MLFKTIHIMMQSGEFMNYIQDKKLRNVVLRVLREHSSMFYFIMESNDNLAFYSTLPFPKDALHRDISLHCTPEFSENIDNIIDHFKLKYPLEILEDKIISD